MFLLCPMLNSSPLGGGMWALETKVIGGECDQSMATGIYGGMRDRCTISNDPKTVLEIGDEAVHPAPSR